MTGTTTTVPTESESRLAGTEQVKHTPGPWMVTEIETVSFAHVSSSENGYGDVCTTWDDPEKANAYLIAAAPDMLAALKAVEQWWLTEEMTSRTCAPYAIFATRDAIAKAEGRTP